MSENMTKSRLEAFSDGVLAIIITIMVLELKIPHETSLHALAELLPVFTSYLLSFVFIGIYWGNHHHLLHTVHHINSKIIWANMALLFSLSLIPFSTGWMGENYFAQLPVATYAVNLLLCAVTYYILQKVIISHYTQSTRLIEALKKQQKKGIISLFIYLTSILCAIFYPVISALLFVVVAVMWIIPDKNIEKALNE
jgi:uncharacterized membrane protein